MAGVGSGSGSLPRQGTGRRRALRIGVGIVLGLVVVALVALTGVGWHYANEILTVPEPGQAARDLEVDAVDDGQVLLRPVEEADDPGVLGLDTPGGYARVGPVAAERDGGVVRPLRQVIRGDIEAGEPARLDGYAYPREVFADPPLFAFALREVTVDGPTGPLPAYYVPGERDTWVLFVHGRGAQRAEAFRLLPTVVARGHPALVVSYRSSQDAPQAGTGQYGLGWTEADDLEAAAAWAREQGAERFVAVGYSMGAAIVGNWLRVHAGEDEVRGLVYDAPVLVWGDTFRLQAQGRGVPGWLTPIAQAVTTLRTGIRFGALDQLRRAEELTVPVLLFHGTADSQVPVATSDAFAAARPDLVTYLRLPDVGHVRAWNADPDAYATAVEAFLDDIDPQVSACWRGHGAALARAMARIAYCVPDQDSDAPAPGRVWRACSERHRMAARKACVCPARTRPCPPPS